MSQENVEQAIAALQAYASTLNQLQQIIIAEGKSSSAVRLMQEISNRDIGMLCWKIPQTWRTDAKYSSQFNALLTEINQTATNIGERIKGQETGLPTLSMLSDQIVMSVARVQKAPPTNESNTQKEEKGSNTEWWKFWK